MNIQGIVDWESKSAEELVKELCEIVIEPKPDAESIYSIAGIAKNFGVQVGEAIYAELVNRGLHGLAARYASIGLDARDPQWLQMADILATVPSLKPVSEQLKYLGFNRHPRWSVLGFSAEPTLEEVGAATAEAITRGADVLLSINRTGGVLRCGVQVLRDGVSIRARGIVEGEGSDADRALVAAIESAVDDYLAGFVDG